MTRLTTTLTILFSFLFSTVYSIDYQTLTDGNYSDVTSVWSTDGGATACSCRPPQPLDGDNVYINHNIIADVNVTLEGGALFQIFSSGSFIGSVVILIRDAAFVTEGVVTIAKLRVNATGSFTANNTLVTATNRILIYGALNMDGSIFRSGGNVLLYPGSSISLINGASIKATGNFQNEGTLFICATCCVSTETGNLFVEPTGTVSGTGAFYSMVGNISNDGVIDTTITWCVAGSSTGMDGNAIDCTGTVAICSASPLAISDISFFLSKEKNNTVNVQWILEETVRGGKYVVQKSNDLESWSDAYIVSSTSSNRYEFVDVFPQEGENYYRIIEVDANDNKAYTEAKSILIMRDVITMYPNLINDEREVKILSKERFESTVSVVDVTGKVVSSQVVNLEEGANTLQLPSQLPPSHYTVVIYSDSYRTSLPLVVM